MMQVTRETSYLEFYPYEPYITEETKRELKEAAVKEFGQYTDLTIERFNQLTTITAEEAAKEYSTVLGVYWLLGFKEFIEEFGKNVQNLTLKPTPMEVSAASACYSTTLIESMLVFCRDWFNLPNYTAAAQTTLGDYLIARKADYNNKSFERRMSELQSQKMKTKK